MAMTEDDLVEDLFRLLREGLVQVELPDEDGVPPRYRLTLRGRAYTRKDDPAPLPDEAQTSEFVDADDWVAR